MGELAIYLIYSLNLKGHIRNVHKWLIIRFFRWVSSLFFYSP
nr:MAG TPA: hypothetical protein [Caudoviricetes sp.]